MNDIELKTKIQFAVDFLELADNYLKNLYADYPNIDENEIVSAGRWLICGCSKLYEILENERFKDIDTSI